MNPHLHLLLLLLAAAALCQGAPLAGELRCRCVRTASEKIPPRRLARLEFVAEGPHCAVPEVIATTKQGQMICLDPVAPGVKLLVTRILRRAIWLVTPKVCPESGFFAGEETTQQVVRERIHNKCPINCKSSHIHPTSCERGKDHLGMKLPVRHKIPGNSCYENTIAQLSSFDGFVDQVFYVSFPLLIFVIAQSYAWFYGLR